VKQAMSLAVVVGLPTETMKSFPKLAV